MWTGVQWTGTLNPGASLALVHVRLADLVARSLVHDADLSANRSPAGRLGRRGRTGERDPVHVLDHGQEPDIESGDL